VERGPVKGTTEKYQARKIQAPCCTFFKEKACGEGGCGKSGKAGEKVALRLAATQVKQQSAITTCQYTHARTQHTHTLKPGTCALALRELH